MAGGAAIGQAGEEADAVVADPDQEAAVGLLEADRDPARLGVGADIRQGLLDNPVRHHPQLVGQLPGRLVGDLGDEAGQLAGPGGVLADGRGQPDLVQQGRAQLEHELAKPPDALGRGSRQPCQRLGGAGVAQPAPEGLKLEADRDHGLDGVVVDVAGDLAPLLLLAGDHPFQQRAALLVELAQVAQGPVVLGDVAQHDQPADRRALPVGHGHHRGLVAAGRSVPGQHQLLGQPVAARARVADRLGGLGQQGGCPAAGTGTGPRPAPGRTRRAGTGSGRSARTARRRSCRAG